MRCRPPQKKGAGSGRLAKPFHIKIKRQKSHADSDKEVGRKKLP